MDLRNLTGKTALVTGAASGIGKATALAFAERGANLVICDVNESGLEKSSRRFAPVGERCSRGRWTLPIEIKWQRSRASCTAKSAQSIC